VSETIIQQLFHLVEEHTKQLKNDIELCATREGHIRATARANEAQNIAALILKATVAEETELANGAA
jgi:hypothetical protein